MIVFAAEEESRLAASLARLAALVEPASRRSTG
jgi:hypothetical protein